MYKRVNMRLINGVIMSEKIRPKIASVRLALPVVKYELVFFSFFNEVTRC